MPTDVGQHSGLTESQQAAAAELDGLLAELQDEADTAIAEGRVLTEAVPILGELNPTQWAAYGSALADLFPDLELPPAPQDRRDGGGRVVELVPAASIKPEPVRWLWKGRLPVGELALLAGEPGVGKGNLTCWLAAHVSRGDLPGDLFGEPRVAVLASAEDDPAHTVVPRLMAAGADLDMVRIVRVTLDDATGVLTLPDDVEAIRAGVEAEAAALVAVDPIGAHLDSGIDSWKDSSVRRALAPLSIMAQETGATALAVGHLRGSDARTVAARIMGSVAFTAAARNVFLATDDPEADDGSGKRVLTHGKTNTGEHAPTLRYRIEGRDVESEGETISTCAAAWLGEAAGVTVDDVLSPLDRDERTDQAEAKRWVLEYLERHGGEAPAGEALRAGEKELAVHKRTIQRARKAAGVVTRKSADGWVWQHPDGGDEDGQDDDTPSLSQGVALSPSPEAVCRARSSDSARRQDDKATGDKGTQAASPCREPDATTWGAE